MVTDFHSLGPRCHRSDNSQVDIRFPHESHTKKLFPIQDHIVRFSTNFYTLIQFARNDDYNSRLYPLAPLILKAVEEVGIPVYLQGYLLRDLDSNHNKVHNLLRTLLPPPEERKEN